MALVGSAKPSLNAQNIEVIPVWHLGRGFIKLIWFRCAV